MPSSRTKSASCLSDHPAATALLLFHLQVDICSPLLERMVTEPLSRLRTGPPYWAEAVSEVGEREEKTPEYNST